MSNWKIGGSAFPRAGNEYSDMTWVEAPAQDGMSLRDYIATHSIQTAMAMVKSDFEKDGQDFHWNRNEREIVAEVAYDLAELMLKARET
tara:strand:- start:734 stop:1000 length:267 start_codon:yes stop_codon:yes gene_type:complete